MRAGGDGEGAYRADLSGPLRFVRAEGRLEGLRRRRESIVMTVSYCWGGELFVPLFFLSSEAREKKRKKPVRYVPSWLPFRTGPALLYILDRNCGRWGDTQLQIVDQRGGGEVRCRCRCGGETKIM